MILPEIQEFELEHNILQQNGFEIDVIKQRLGFWRIIGGRRSFRVPLNDYSIEQKEDDLKFLRDSLLMLQGEIVKQMLSREFTELKAEEKDIRQRAYAQTNEIIAFLVDPMVYIKSALKIQQYNSQPQRRDK